MNLARIPVEPYCNIAPVNALAKKIEGCDPRIDPPALRRPASPIIQREDLTHFEVTDAVGADRGMELAAVLEATHRRDIHVEHLRHVASRHRRFEIVLTRLPRPPASPP